MHKFIIMAAVDDKFGLSKDGKIPWRRTPEGKVDMATFRDKTWDTICIMGRGTYESICGSLPGREIVVISTKISPARSFVSVKDALVNLQETDPDRQVVICGGRGVYLEALQFVEFCTEISISRIPGDWECDHMMPEFESYISSKSASNLSM